ncbi:uncharacterized protein LOC141905259 [Tubulanus polymorphus]|uniref:uncharacterized protein LOC141905259 n=1 Tax=Tubulanus polymorphus TaxID=672921 RepID=UPI003DA6ADD7
MLPVSNLTRMRIILKCRHVTSISSYDQFVTSFRSYSDVPGQVKPIRIGCASGFWGDTAVSVPQLVHHGKIDFLVFDYLSEITMSLLTAVKAKNSDFGYCPDFVHAAIGPFVKDIKSKGIRVISNAGGVNPFSCAHSLSQVAKKSSVDLKIAVVAGDDLKAYGYQLDEKDIIPLDGNNTSLPEKLQSVNAYLGAGPIAQALDEGADVVITGRCVDSAVVLAPLMHKFKWKPDQYDMLAAGSLAGHLVECGAQSTGGIFTDWDQVNGWENIGFPIVECSADGSFILTKPPNTGGLVSFATAAEQLVYEIGDPKRYVLPDVICDFSQVDIKEIEGLKDAVQVTGARGYAPSHHYKVCATYADGYRATAVACIGGMRSREKGHKTAQAILKRMRGIYKQLGLKDFQRVNIQILGTTDSYFQENKSSHSKDLKEAVLWIAAHHHEKRALELFAREIASAGTGMAPGLTGIVGGRPKVSPVLHLYSFLYPKDKISVTITLDDSTPESYMPPVIKDGTSPREEVDKPASVPLQKGDNTYKLVDLAYARSGDKGNSANIGIIARDSAFLPYIREYITEEVVEEFFSHLFNKTGEKAVHRYEWPGIDGFNFVLSDVLGGGGVASLRSDPQGKAFAQLLLDYELRNMPNLLELRKDSRAG